MQQEPGGEPEPLLDACVVRFASARSDVTARVLWVNGDTEVEYARLHPGVSGRQGSVPPPPAAAGCSSLPAALHLFSVRLQSSRPRSSFPHSPILTAVLVQSTHVHHASLAAAGC